MSSHNFGSEAEITTPQPEHAQPEAALDAPIGDGAVPSDAFAPSAADSSEAIALEQSATTVVSPRLAAQGGGMVPPGQPTTQSSYTLSVPPTPIVMRTLIITSDASIIIGKQGRHINEIREMSNARLNISESIPSNPERILTVSGALDAVSKAFGLIVRRINDEPFDQPSVPGSRAVTIRFIVPNARMGSIIGKQGSRIKEIQEASGARLNAGEAMLPGSTERILSVTGVADAVHIAAYYIGTILLEHQDRVVNNLAYRPAPASRAMPAPAPGFPPASALAPQPAAVGGPAPAAASPYGFGAPSAPAGMPPPALAPGSQTQQIFIPNDLVGCIIGKGGQKINEIRQLSASHIKIMERGAGIAAGGSGSERLVTITGPPPNIQMAVSLLYQRLEQENMRLSQGAPPGH
ncbi:PAB1 binding protein [Malassezia sp. CBS 17886]|nr:PAB1 binding protein [Malassezia sp. CBS 17886]